MSDGGKGSLQRPVDKKTFDSNWDKIFNNKGKDEDESLMLCTKCKIDKPKTLFYKDKSKPSGFHTNCKLCQSSRNKAKRVNDPKWHNLQKEKSKQYRKTNPIKSQLKVKDCTYRAKYGVTYLEFLEKIKSQKGICKICSTPLVIEGRNCPQKAVIDHCHITGKVRGIICHRCNVGLGNFLDDANLLKFAQEYILSESFF